MCRWLAYQGSPIYLDQLVYEPEHSLVHQSLDARKAVTRVNADGFGLGWYTERTTPGQFHDVLPAWGDENLRSLTHHICSHRFMVHVRSSTGTQVSRSNCHPFIIDNWMFLHNGQIGGFDQLRYLLERQLCEVQFLQRKGTTDSELIFMLMLQNGLRDNPIKAIQTTLRDIVQLMQTQAIEDPLKASICISDGTQFWVIRYSSSGDAPTVFIKQRGSDIVLASEPLEPGGEWRKIDAQTIVTICGDKVVSIAV
ncbi:class II glutamine amidotransferase [Vibrio pacinii]|uniref:class II glutamine amidotransferase n=1 Tax=Vibrio pacinii TaxID=170674 RepID=UPI0005719691|nr:class II glutamine amidotransferase [Vibrio pacinii]